MQYGDLIFFALVAVYLFFKLGSTLGKKEDGDNSFNNVSQNKVTPLGGGASAPTIATPNINIQATPVISEKDFFAGFDISENLKQPLKDIAQKDATFSLDYFSTGAKMAFDMVMKAFSQDDKETLKALVSKDIYQTLTKIIDKNKSDNIDEKRTVVSVKIEEFSDVKLNGNIAEISLKLFSEQINFKKDIHGNIISGSSIDIEEVTDEWKFERNLKSSNPNWVITQI